MNSLKMRGYLGSKAGAYQVLSYKLLAEVGILMPEMSCQDVFW